MSEPHIDDAIDAAVRDLMNVDAEPAFRARVVERLRKPALPAGIWRQLSLVGAAIAIVVIGAVLIRNGRPPAADERGGALAIAVAPPGPAPEPQAPERPPAVATRLPVRAGARPSASNPTHAMARGALAATVAGAPAAEPAEGVEPLNGIMPIEVPPITQAPIITTEIAVAPLAPLSGLVIAPLDLRTARD